MLLLFIFGTAIDRQRNSYCMKLPYLFAKRFVAGETFQQAAPKVRALNDQKIKITLDLLGENVSDRQMADEAVSNYIDLLNEIEEAGLESTISIKLTMLGLDIDESYCRDNLFRLLERAKELGQFVRIDMEGSDYTEQTISLYKEAHQRYGNHTGIVLQAYLHRTEEDIRELAEMGADIRLCKGAYKEPERIALQDMKLIRQAFKDYTSLLLAQTRYPRIATHDDELIEWVKEYAKEHDIGKDRFEFQMLYGLREETMLDLTEKGYNCRIYVPYGTMWLPYFKRRLMERKENIWFVLSTMFKS